MRTKKEIKTRRKLVIIHNNSDELEVTEYANCLGVAHPGIEEEGMIMVPKPCVPALIAALKKLSTKG